MKRVCPFCFSLLVLSLSVPVPAQHRRIAFEGRQNFIGISGEEAVFDARFYVAIGDATTDVTGWSYGIIAAGGITVTDISDQGTLAAAVDGIPPGLRDGGFSLHELTTDAEPLSECDGLAGAVGTVVLSFDHRVTLPPTRWVFRHRVAEIHATVSGVTPLQGKETVGELRFVDGCIGSGDPILTRINVGDASLVPRHYPHGVRLRGGLEDCDPRRCEDAPEMLALRFEGTRTTGAPDSGCPQNPARLEVEDIPPGTQGSKDIFVRLVTRRAGEGVQGWSLSLATTTGDIEITEAHHRGTIAAFIDDDPPGLVDHGFSVVELAHPENHHLSDCVGMWGVVQAIVLSFSKPITLEPTSDHRILALTVETLRPVPPPVDEETASEVTGEIQFVDECKGSGTPVDSVATVDGRTAHFDCKQALRVAFLSALPPRDRNFLRCDPNDDGRIDIADAIWIVNDLFRGGPKTRCEMTMDCNGDGRADITDALFAVQSLFGLGNSLPEGGFCETAPPEVCEVASSVCP